MPEISDSEFRSFIRFQALGTPEEVEKKVRDLETDNKKQRDELRERDEKLKSLPPEGAVVLVGDEAKAYPAVKELVTLGKPEEIKAKLENGEKAVGRVAELERQQAVQSAAAAAGYKASVLEKLPGSDKLRFEVKEETVKDAQGKDTKVNVAYVTSSEEGATPKKLAEHAEAAWGDFLPSLKQAAASTEPVRKVAGQVETGAAAEPAKGSVDDAIKQNHARATAPNPLRPAKTT